MFIGLAACFYRTGFTVRLAASTQGSAEIHDGLGVFRGIVFRGMGFGQLPELVLNFFLAVPAAYRVVATQDPFDIAIKNRERLVQAQREDSGGR